MKCSPFSTLFTQAVKFGAVGLLNTALDLGIYFLLTRSLGVFAALPVAAKAFAYLASVLNSFVLNRSWTFNSSAQVGRALPVFTAASLIGLLVNAGVLNLAFNLLQAPEIFALGLATAASLAWNFCASRWLVFRPAVRNPLNLDRIAPGVRGPGRG